MVSFPHSAADVAYALEAQIAVCEKEGLPFKCNGQLIRAAIEALRLPPQAIVSALDSCIAAIEFECPAIRNGVEVERRTRILENVAREAQEALRESKKAVSLAWNTRAAPRRGTSVDR